MADEFIYGRSAAFQKLVERIDRYAALKWPVLLLGETGVGKELIARRIHQKSARRAGPFVGVNCGAIPTALFESEFFGYERGAFSGAVQPSRGLLREAHGGTIFLDEIGELDLNTQTKLLRFLDRGEVRPLGQSQEKGIDVRVVAATNKDLYGAVQTRHFRQDLLERLSVLVAEIPPLRSRKPDIALIAKSLALRLDCRISDEALKLLPRYPWPGNVRQLRNVLVRASVDGQGHISGPTLQSLLAEELARPRSIIQSENDLFEGTLADIEKQVIVQTLKRCHGNRKQTAEELGIAKSTLHEKLRKWKDQFHEPPPWPLSRWDPSAYDPALVL